uniref:Uncharacterized protein n=1 Tax=Physcomitrium patens TaxID=3218 RepID=A0A2K1JCT3_PHYPA|nr:hypothetical protein PHYPA_019611 [Physcomitrium patens]
MTRENTITINTATICRLMLPQIASS